ncbi:MAG TPA: PilZ domain-containing protein [Sphingomonas sp.]|jgi:hypothetical protein|nr:PilZ domain-containing protein [Sphingomonas sp.]
MNVVANKPSKEDRRANRRALTLRADLRESGSARYPVDVLDLSETGFSCESWDAIGLGKSVFLQIESFAPFPARVVWRDGNLHGFQFVRALYPAVVDTIAQRFEFREPQGPGARRTD